MLNKKLLQLTLDTIKANPQHWDQQQWHCGTTHCFVGFAYLLHHNLPLTTTEHDLGIDILFRTRGEATILLGLAPYQANRLFSAGNTLEDLEHIVHVLLNTDVPLFSSANASMV